MSPKNRYLQYLLTDWYFKVENFSKNKIICTLGIKAKTLIRLFTQIAVAKDFKQPKFSIYKHYDFLSSEIKALCMF